MFYLQVHTSKARSSLARCSASTTTCARATRPLQTACTAIAAACSLSLTSRSALARTHHCWIDTAARCSCCFWLMYTPKAGEASNKSGHAKGSTREERGGSGGRTLYASFLPY